MSQQLIPSTLEKCFEIGIPMFFSQRDLELTFLVGYCRNCQQYFVDAKRLYKMIQSKPYRNKYLCRKCNATAWDLRIGYLHYDFSKSEIKLAFFDERVGMALAKDFIEFCENTPQTLEWIHLKEIPIEFTVLKNNLTISNDILNPTTMIAQFLQLDKIVQDHQVKQTP